MKGRTILSGGGILLLCLLFSCGGKETDTGLSINGRSSVEAGGVIPLSVYLNRPDGGVIFSLEWETSAGEIRKTRVENETDFLAPSVAGPVIVRASVGEGKSRLTAEKRIDVLERGALGRTVRIRLEVDTDTLYGVYVDENAPGENFTPPLTVKGTFTYNEPSGAAASGGNWTNYVMYDDGTHGDREAVDGIWTLLMDFEKSTEKVHFAFDEGSSYRVEWESGLAWRLKTAWIDLDDFPADRDNPAFIPDSDRVLLWDRAMAEAGNIYGGSR